jgi:hypothetical protein
MRRTSRAWSLGFASIICAAIEATIGAEKLVPSTCL